MKPPLPVSRGDAFELAEFLRGADLTTSGIGEPGLLLWIDLDADGRIVGSTGIELDGSDALLRSVAVAAPLRRMGRGREPAEFALQRARDAGATRAWLFSRRSAEFWGALGFERADIDDLVDVLSATHQVVAFAASGALRYETAWSRPLL